MKRHAFANSLLALLGIPVSCALSACASQEHIKPAGEATALVRTASGDISGIRIEKESVELFAGVPYAAPPVGELRWKAPKPVEPWQGVRAADHFAPIAMQARRGKLMQALINRFIYHEPRGSREQRQVMSEDCLYLNIWRPSDTPNARTAGTNDTTGAPLPVLIYFHGGSLTGGSSIYEDYDGATFAKNGVIMVTVAYRLGVFGYFADQALIEESLRDGIGSTDGGQAISTTGNYGLLDQIAALRWVHENIAAFGGDASNITIAGESAGACSVTAMCTSPLTQGLFVRAILESSTLASPQPPHSYRSMEDALKAGDAVKKEFGKSTLAELRTIPAKDLVRTKAPQNALTIDGYALTRMPYESYLAGENWEQEALHGFNAREGDFVAFFLKAKDYEKTVRSYFKHRSDEILAQYPGRTKNEAKKNWSTLCGAVLFANSHHVLSELLTAQGKRVYEYYFTKENGGIGTNHSGEMLYAYGNVPQSKNYDEHDRKLSDAMVRYWTNFAKTGDPNSETTAIHWPTYNEKPGMVLELGEHIEMRTDPFSDLYPVIADAMKAE